MERCKVINRKGRRCGSKPIEGSEYCLHHQDQAPKPRNKPPFYKSPFYIVGTLVIGLIVAILFWTTSATKKGQQITHDRKAYTHNQLEIIKRILNARLEKASTELRGELLLKYELGYCLLAINRYRTVTSPIPKLSTDYEIDWSSFNIIEYDYPHSIKLNTPIIKDIFGNTVSSSNNVGIRLDRKTPFLVLGFEHDIIQKPVNLYAQIINSSVEGLIVLFGLSHTLIPNI